MSNKKALVTEQHLYDIAGSIRKKLNVETAYKPSEMPEAIDSISGGYYMMWEIILVPQQVTLHNL